MKHSEEQLFKAVDEILFYLWDPLDCKEIPAARDEYRSYVPKVLDYLTSDNNEEKNSKVPRWFRDKFNGKKCRFTKFN